MNTMIVFSGKLKWHGTDTCWASDMFVTSWTYKKWNLLIEESTSIQPSCYSGMLRHCNFYCIIFFRAGKPTPGLHLDVLKDGKMIQVTLPINFLPNGKFCILKFFVFCWLFQNQLFKKKFFQEYLITIRVSNSLDPDQDLSCLQRLSGYQQITKVTNKEFGAGYFLFLHKKVIGIKWTPHHRYMRASPWDFGTFVIREQPRSRQSLCSEDGAPEQRYFPYSYGSVL